MKKINTVKKNDDFSNIIHKGKYYKNKYFTIYTLENNLDYYRFGISVGKKSGNAVTRNKIKRQMRYIIDKYKKYYPKRIDYIVVIRYNYIEGSFDEIENLFKRTIKKIYEEISNEEK